MKRYRITCLKCNNSNIAAIYPAGPGAFRIDLDDDHNRSNHVAIISGRYRRDMNFGWECICGNDSRLARQELPQVDELVVGGGHMAIQKIVKSLEVTDENKFLMQEA
jgi:hypothetical protein